MPLPVGNQALRFTPPGGSQTTHTLQFRLHNLRPAKRKHRMSAGSVTGDEDFVWTNGSAADEITASIRYDDKPTELLGFLEAGADGIQVTLDTNTTNSSTGTNIPCSLVQIGDEQGIRADRDRYAMGEYQTQVTLRAVGDNDFNDLIN